MIGGWQASAFGLAADGGARLSVRIVGPLAIQAGYAYWFFGGNAPQPDASIQAGFGGIRLAPRLGQRFGGFFIDVDGGYATTGQSRASAMIDAGIGWEFPVARFLAIGPVVRGGIMFYDRAPNQRTDDAHFWSGGLELTLRVPEEQAPAGSAPRDSDRDSVLDPDDACPSVPGVATHDAHTNGCPPPLPPPDRDRDGVLDVDDACPNEPSGAHPDPRPDRRGCPLRDTDSDGVTDDADQCPTDPAGEHPDPMRAGCPDPDGDHDGVTDHQDQCPTEPAGAHPDPARPGCPQWVVVQEHEIEISQQVHFATDQSVILQESFPILQAVANELAAHPEIRSVSIEGHTDDAGSAGHNRGLSRRRARSVLTWLVQHGVDRGRLTSSGYGNARPLDRAGTPEARAANRRVEFHIVRRVAATANPSSASPPTAHGVSSPSPSPTSAAPAGHSHHRAHRHH